MIDITNKLLDIEIGKYCFNTKAKQSIVLDSACCPFGGTLPSGTRKNDSINFTLFQNMGA